MDGTLGPRSEKAKAMKVLLEEGYRLCMTLNFSITQHMAFAELLSKGRDQEYLVLMAGQLDDKIAAELADTMQMCGAHSLAEITRDMVRI